ncbi:LAME_0G03092g1_1 [Lachancea meyersii CBS 8951]|uniref:LAME_0G03092g1_1 n=1 Tax=Lachancea meyersii CBS 8951 TaxID=1266667 RepID=A0A1G4K6E6_9SACH|nr:LAME_0G03092g1_1 [Lachancea meyersii CBS 8951]
MLVAKLDSTNLDNELFSTLWSLLQKNAPPTHFIEESKLLLNALIFYFSCRNAPGGNTYTYGSFLTGVLFQKSKRFLFLANVLLPELLRHLQKILISTTDARLQWSAFINIVTHVWCFNTFLQFLSSNNGYLSLTHKLLRIKPKLGNTSEFYTATINSNIQFYNSQLLYNAILQLLKSHIFKSRTFSTLLKRRKPLPNTIPRSKDNCPNCRNAPVNPYVATCCGSQYCYICMLKCIQSKSCSFCDSTSIHGKPLYNHSVTKLKENT